MIKACTLESLQALFASSRKKAEKETPIVKTVDFTQTETGYFAHYSVSNSAGSYYDVFIGRDESNFWVGCKCRGGLEGKNCYHGYQALMYYRLKLIDVERNADVNAPYLKPDSGKKPDKIGGYRI